MPCASPERSVQVESLAEKLAVNKTTEEASKKTDLRQQENPEHWNGTYIEETVYRLTG